MASNQQTKPQPGRSNRDSKTDAVSLFTLIVVGGWRGLAPAWVRHTPFAVATPEVLRWAAYCLEDRLRAERLKVSQLDTLSARAVSVFRVTHSPTEWRAE